VFLADHMKFLDQVNKSDAEDILAALLDSVHHVLGSGRSHTSIQGIAFRREFGCEKALP